MGIRQNVLQTFTHANVSYRLHTAQRCQKHFINSHVTTFDLKKQNKMLNTVSSQRVGLKFDSHPGVFYLEFAFSPCVCVGSSPGSPASSHSP